MGGRRKKTRTHVKPEDDPEQAKVPKSFVMRSGQVTSGVAQLVHDIRRVMEPNTATKLRERKNNKLKDFLSVAGMLGVTHFVVFTKTDRGTNLRIARAPKGPTLTFRIQQYSLMKDVLAAQQKPRSPGQEYLFAPLLVLNNFTGGSQPVKLMATMFQNMFPSLNVQKMHISDCRRVVLLDYDTESESISFRHYYINVKPVGLSKSVKRIMNTSIPNLNKFEDIGDYVLREAIASESDVEDAGENVVTLSENYIGRNNQKSSQRAIRLVNQITSG